MEDFKKLPKMQAFKVGGKVASEYCSGGAVYKKEGGKVDAEDIKQDKKIIKKAFAMHDKQEHGGEKTDLSKLKKGGRAKKEVGTVNRYKVGGPVSMKKDAEDIKEIAEVKKEKAQKLCGGKSVKKMADGKSSGPLDTVIGIAKRAYNRGKRNLLGTDAQNAQAQADIDARNAAAAAAAAAQPSTGATPASQPAQEAPAGIPAQKRGGKVKGKC